ncbi:chloride channel protein [Taibaiella sp. KBW10]|nr:chloride channel protein [Taibaiella sp. KBW10]
MVTLKNSPGVVYTRRYLKNAYDKTIETNAQLKHQSLQFLPFLLASLITGVVAFLYSKVFSYSESLSVYLYHQNKYLIFLITPVCFLLSWWLVKRMAPYAKGSGIPQVMAALELTNPKDNALISRFLSLKIILVKIVSSAIKIIGGGIAGREGPTIQIASSIFYQVHKWLPKWWTPISQSNILIAGAASGLAAAFNTPLGGIIFAIEELSKFHVKHYKSPLFIAVIVAGLTAQGLGGSYLYLGYPKLATDEWLLIIVVVLTAIVAGFFGSKMCVVLLKVIQFFGKIKNQFRQMGVVVFCGLFVATFIFYFGTEAMGSGKELMERTLFTSDKTVAWYLPFIRMNGLIASFSFGGAGGVFAPSLSSGASIGALIAQITHFSGPDANLLILIGMTAFLTGVTRAPFTSAIIIFEMTDRHSVIFFLLLAAIIANLISSFVDKHSFYDRLKENYLREVR